MGLISGLLTLPLAPIRGTVWLAEQIADEADRRMHDPAFVRQQLEEVAAARASGALSPEEADRMERELVGRLLQRRGPGPRNGRDERR